MTTVHVAMWHERLSKLEEVLSFHFHHKQTKLPSSQDIIRDNWCDHHGPPEVVAAARVDDGVHAAVDPAQPSQDGEGQLWVGDAVRADSWRHGWTFSLEPLLSAQNSYSGWYFCYVYYQFLIIIRAGCFVWRDIKLFWGLTIITISSLMIGDTA